MKKLEFPKTLPEFQKFFPDDKACAEYLEALRWPDGFVCPVCDHKGEPYRFSTRSSNVLRCRVCKKNASLTAGTSMQQSHTPLSVWFWAAYLMTTQTPGMSALQFQRQLGIKTYETAFNILHKLRSAMVRPNRDGIGGEFPVEIDEAFVGGATRGEGKGVHHKALVIGAVEVRPRTKETSAKGHGNRKIYAGRLRLQVIPDRKKESLSAFTAENILGSTTVRTDGWEGYNELSGFGYNHESLTLAGDPAKAEAHLPMIHLVFSNLKTWILGTHHGAIDPKHLQSYLDEYVFRFNRRFYPMTAFNSVLGLAAQSVPPTYEQLYSGTYERTEETGIE
jgi:transposase-like protein